MSKNISFLDVGMAADLKNWMRCKCDPRQHEHLNAQRLAWERFYNQTRAYLKNFQRLKKEQLCGT